MSLNLLRPIVLAILFSFLGSVSIVVAGSMDDERLACFPAENGATRAPHGWYFFEGRATRYWLDDESLAKKKYGPYEEMLGKLYFISDELVETTHLLDLKNMVLEHIVSGLIYQCETKSSSKQVKTSLDSYVKTMNP